MNPGLQGNRVNHDPMFRSDVVSKQSIVLSLLFYLVPFMCALSMHVYINVYVNKHV